MTTVPAVSVVIPTRNRAGTIRRAVDSVLAAGERVEVVVADDASEDSTLEVLAAIGEPRLRLLATETRGGANRARNRGAAAARADVFAFLDSDDVFRPGRIERLGAFFRQHLDIDCLMDGYVDHASGGRVTTHRLPPAPPDKTAIRHMLIAHQLPLTTSAIAVRRKAFEAIGGFDEALMRHQDRDLLLRLLENGSIAFGDATDVGKYRASASISHEYDGYIAGLDAFIGTLPERLDPRYADLFGYLAARGIIKPLVQGHPAAAFRETARLARAANFPGGPVAALLRYRRGRRYRYTMECVNTPARR